MPFQSFRPKVKNVEAIYFTGSEASAAEIVESSGGAIFVDMLNPNPSQIRLRLFTPVPGRPQIVFRDSWIVRQRSEDDPSIFLYASMTGAEFAATYVPSVTERVRSPYHPESV